MTDTMALLPIIAFIALVSAYAAWLVIHAPARYWIKWLLIPATLSMWFAVWPLASTILGFAYAHRLPAKFTLLSYVVVVEDGRKTAIEVWAAGERSRLYSVPYTKPMADALATAAKKGGAGGRVVMERKKRNGQGGGQVDADEDNYESNLVLPSDDNPKDAQ